jgi:hypothetical protein
MVSLLWQLWSNTSVKKGTLYLKCEDMRSLDTAEKGQVPLGTSFFLLHFIFLVEEHYKKFKKKRLKLAPLSPI